MLDAVTCTHHHGLERHVAHHHRNAGLEFDSLRQSGEQSTATDEALLRAMFLLWERMKIVVEPTGVLGAAAHSPEQLDIDLRWIREAVGRGYADAKKFMELAKQ